MGHKESTELLHPSQTTCFFHLGGFTTPLHTLAHGSTVVFLAPEDLDPDISLMLDVAAKTMATSIMCGSHHLIQVHVASDKILATKASDKLI